MLRNCVKKSPTAPPEANFFIYFFILLQTHTLAYYLLHISVTRTSTSMIVDNNKFVQHGSVVVGYLLYPNMSSVVELQSGVAILVRPRIFPRPIRQRPGLVEPLSLRCPSHPTQNVHDPFGINVILLCDRPIPEHRVSHLVVVVVAGEEDL